MVGINVCRAGESCYFLVADDNTRFAIEDIDCLIASDMEPTFSVVLKNGTVSGPVTKACFEKEACDESGVTDRTTVSLSVFPNPVREMLYVTCNGNDVRLLEIFSVNGALVKSIKSTGAETSVFVGDLPRGKYLLRTGRTSLFFIKD